MTPPRQLPARNHKEQVVMGITRPPFDSREIPYPALKKLTR